ncbi:MAG: acylneuraminate cytidylyltransferase family protein [Candidatus Omnitrophica bacterium]|nr:acylneuraminate cytidylyltransferase family protein [Candidatus Omnitrophota bacterium]
MNGKTQMIAVIPARGGSKGIPKKNIRLLEGKPLLVYTIEQARKSSSLKRVIVSTDDDEIAAVARRNQAEVVRRPAELAQDTSRTEEALIHALESLRERENYRPEAVVTLEPTSPLRPARLIDECIRLFKETDADSVITVTETRECLGRIREGRFEFLFPNQPRRRQEREPLFKENSAVYVTQTETLLRKRSVLGDRLYAVVCSPEEAIDINTEHDLIVAETLLRLAQQRQRVYSPA